MRSRDREAASIKRLKQRIARVSWRFPVLTSTAMRQQINAAIDAWCKAEGRRTK